MTTSVLERFFEYVTYDTQSSESSDTYPSTPEQLVLLRDLVERAAGSSASPTPRSTSTAT